MSLSSLMCTFPLLCSLSEGFSSLPGMFSFSPTYFQSSLSDTNNQSSFICSQISLHPIKNTCHVSYLFFLVIEIEKKLRSDQGQRINKFVNNNMLLLSLAIPPLTEIKYCRNLLSFCVRKIAKETELILDTCECLPG